MTSDRSKTISFPRLNARNLEGLDVKLPDAFDGDRNVVLVAFRREHQSLVDSWVPWLEERVALEPEVKVFEVPVIGRMWAPMRRFIDGGMAASIKVPRILQRTLTVYGPVDALTEPLGITDRSTITVLLLDAKGSVLWSCTGGHTHSKATQLSSQLSSQ